MVVFTDTYGQTFIRTLAQFCAFERRSYIKSVWFVPGTCGQEQYVL